MEIVLYQIHVLPLYTADFALYLSLLKEMSGVQPLYPLVNRSHPFAGKITISCSRICDVCRHITLIMASLSEPQCAWVRGGGSKYFVSIFMHMHISKADHVTTMVMHTICSTKVIGASAVALSWVVSVARLFLVSIQWAESGGTGPLCFPPPLDPPLTGTQNEISSWIKHLTHATPLLACNDGLYSLADW